MGAPFSCRARFSCLSLQGDLYSWSVVFPEAITNLSATAATVDNRSKPVLSSVWCAEPADRGAAVVGCAGAASGAASLRATCFSGSGGAGGADAVATGTDGATGRAGAAVRVASIRPHHSYAVGARVRAGTATAAVGEGALHIASGLEW